MSSKEKILLFLLLGSFCGVEPQTKVVNHTKQWMTIIVHGTVMPYVSLFDVLKLKNKTLQPTMLTRINKLYRKNPFFYQSQPIQGFGLQPIHFARAHHGNAAQAFGKTFHILNKKCFPERKLNRYYTFGWSGLLNEKVRQDASKQLYEELLKEIKKLRTFSDGPIHITLCGFSHGGNVCLELPDHMDSKNPPFAIDDLILYGTPIQEESYNGMMSPTFKNIYNFYSLGDRIQKLDFITGRETGRVFEAKSMSPEHQELPSNLKQIRLRFNRRKTTYRLGKEYAEKTKKRIYPGHIEMWFFGWTDKWYRPHFPLRPFPVAVFTPFILKTINELGTTNTMTIEMAPKIGQTMVVSYDDKNNKTSKITNSMTNSDIHWLQKKVRAYSPQNFKRTYRTRFNNLIKKARKQLRLGK
ncbi:hypothetical protein HOM50_00790 [bacterium]|jgi:hypothetical protein|nr:hypothetical protein [bacterium]MBT5014927.1 hypothetical protein [bacterium]